MPRVYFPLLNKKTNHFLRSELKMSLMRIAPNELLPYSHIMELNFITRPNLDGKNVRINWLIKNKIFLKGLWSYRLHGRDDIVICITAAKKMDFDKGTAQNIVQMHSVVERLSKRKREDTDLEDSEEVPVIVYGIVSNA